MQKQEAESKARNAKDFGFDLMEYEDSGNVHSTNLVWKLSADQSSGLQLKDLILASRVASNSNKSLTIEYDGKKVRTNYLKKL